jgi:hypothetical protein
MDAKKLILVWDMDQTLIGNNVDSEKLIFNDAALHILSKAIEKKCIIFLLTNNPADEYIQKFHIALSLKLKVSYVFDGMMTATDSDRVLDAGGVPIKHLQDIKILMDRSENSYDETLASRVYFFDDIPNHVLATELPEGHYIVIKPPFRPSQPDETDYSSIRLALGMSGGSKKKRKLSKKCKRSRKFTRLTQKN